MWSEGVDRMVKPIVTTAKFESQCKTCEGTIHVMEEVNWVPGVGAWHMTCKPPRSLDMYVREQEKLKRLGLA